MDLVKTLSFYNAYSNGNITEQSDLFSEYTDEYGNLLIDEENVSALLDEKLEPYNTYQNHIFTTHDGRELQIKGGTYGNKIAMKNEKKELLTFLQSEETEYIRIPEYTKEAPIKGKNDIGEAQHVFVHLGMKHPMRNLFQPGNIVHEQHQKHGDGTKYIDGGYTCGFHNSRFKDRFSTKVGKIHEKPIISLKILIY